MNKKELEKLLDKAREFNKSRNISGLLIYRAGNFLQILEGPIDDLTQLYSKITHDKRHEDVRLLLHAMIEERLFERWHMGLLNLEDRITLDQERLEEITNTPVDEEAPDINPAQKKALAIVREFRAS